MFNLRMLITYVVDAKNKRKKNVSRLITILI